MEGLEPAFLHIAYKGEDPECLLGKFFPLQVWKGKESQASLCPRGSCWGREGMVWVHKPVTKGYAASEAKFPLWLLHKGKAGLAQVAGLGQGIAAQLGGGLQLCYDFLAQTNYLGGKTLLSLSCSVGRPICTMHHKIGSMCSALAMCPEIFMCQGLVAG